MRAKWERAVDEFLARTPDAIWNGGHKALVEQLNELIPTQGAVESAFPALEKFRQMQNVMYDIYNNGGCNLMYLEDRDQWGVSKAVASNLRLHPEKLEERTLAAMFAAAAEFGIQVPRAA